MTEVAQIQINNQYRDIIQLDEYNGQYSIVSAREGKDGKVFPQWVFPQDKNRQPRDKAIPLKVTLGDKQTAARHLRYLADVLESKGGADPVPDYPQGDDVGDDDSLPF